MKVRLSRYLVTHREARAEGAGGIGGAPQALVMGKLIRRSGDGLVGKQLAKPLV